MQAQSRKIVLIGDNSEEFGYQCREMLRDADLQVVLTEKDGKEVWENILALRPQVVVLDAVMPHYDAVNILHKIKNEQLDIRAITVMSQGNPYLENEITRCGAYCMVRPLDMQYLKDCIFSMSELRPLGLGVMPQTQESSGSITLEVLVADVIFSVGIPAHIKGYTYLRKAIMLSIVHPEMIGSVTKTLYPEVAKAFGTTSSRVERAIRHAIELAWDRGDVDVLESYFGYTINNGRGKPTNSEFVAMIADRLRLKVQRAMKEEKLLF